MRGYATDNGDESGFMAPISGESMRIAGVLCTFTDRGLTGRYVGEDGAFRVVALPPIDGSVWAVGITAHGVLVTGAAMELEEATSKALAHLAAILGLSILSSLASAVAS